MLKFFAYQINFLIKISEVSILKRAIIFLLVIFSVCAAANAEEKFLEVQAQGTGTSIESAMMNAIEEALRKSMGTMILSREEIANDSLTDKIIQVSRGSIKHSKILSEKSQNGKITLDVLFKIDPSKIKEILRTVKPASLTATSADIVKRPLLEHGKNLISK